MIGLYIVLGLIVLIAICVLIIWIQAKRIKSYKIENASLIWESHNAASRLEHIREYTAKDKIVMEEAEHEKRELEETSDGNLVHRANALFRGGGGLRKPGSGGTGNGGT